MREQSAPHGLSEFAWALLLESSFRVYATSGGRKYREVWYLDNRVWLYSAARNPASYARKLGAAS